MSVSSHLIIEQREDLLWVCINRAEQRNALSRAVLAELGEVFALRAGEPTLKAAVLTAQGDKAFAAGGDLREFAGIRSEDAAAALFRSAQHALDRVRNFPVPVVAALNGLAVGGGAELAVACDFRVAASHAAIGFIHARLNISTGFGGGTDLMRVMGASRALLCALRADVLGAREAQALGLIDAITDDGESLENCALRFLAPIRRQTPRVIRAYKAMAIAARNDRTRDERLECEVQGFVNTWCHDDHWHAAERILKENRRGTLA